MGQYGEVVARWRGLGIRTDAELAAALNAHCVAFAYNSGKLENERVTYGDTREIFDRDSVSAYTGDLRTLFEIRNASIVDPIKRTTRSDRFRREKGRGYERIMKGCFHGFQHGESL